MIALLYPEGLSKKRWNWKSISSAVWGLPGRVLRLEPDSLHLSQCEAMSGRTGQKTASKPPGVGSPSVPVTDRGGKKVNLGFSDFGIGGSNQLRDPRLRRSTGNELKIPPWERVPYARRRLKLHLKGGKEHEMLSALPARADPDRVHCGRRPPERTTPVPER
jgi:hypothetical protein